MKQEQHQFWCNRASHTLDGAKQWNGRTSCEKRLNAPFDTETSPQARLPERQKRRMRSSCRKIQIPRNTSRHLHPCAGGSVEQDEHVIYRPHRIRSLQQEDQDAGGDSDAESLFNFSAVREETLSQKNNFRRHFTAERKAEEGKMTISFTVSTLNLAVSFSCPANRRSQHL